MSSKSIQRGPELIVPEHYSTVAEMLIYIADIHPEKGMTYISSSGDEQFESYPELLIQARKYLQSLQEQGIQQGQVVILEIDQSQEFYRTFWACMLGALLSPQLVLRLPGNQAQPVWRNSRKCGRCSGVRSLSSRKPTCPSISNLRKVRYSKVLC